MSRKEISLYKLAKYTNLEIVLEAQLQSTGANQSRLMEKFKKNKNSVKQQAIALKVVYAFIFSMITILPLMTFLNIKNQLASVLSQPDPIMFSGTILFGIFFVMQFVYVILFGMLSIGALMSGEIFKWFETLPISRRSLRKLGFYTLLRNFDIALIVMALSFPILMIILSQNILLIISSFVLSFANIIFTFSILVIISAKISKIFRVHEIKSKKATAIRVLTMLGYAIGAFSIGFLMQLAFGAANSLISIAIGIDDVNFYNYILNLIPYPFAPSSLITLCIYPERFSILYWITSIIGNVLFGACIYLVYKKALKTMRLVTSSKYVEISSFKTKEEELRKEIKVEIKKNTPIVACIKKDLSTATRDIQTLMFIIMPLLLPFIIVITMISASGGSFGTFQEDFLWLWGFLIFYQPIISMMITSGFLNLEDTGAAILASLPLHPREQAKAKLILLISIQTASFFLPLIVFAFNPFFITFLVIFLVWYPIVLTFLLNMFYMKIRLFGRMKYKFVLEEVNPEKKIVKWILMIFSEFGICFFYLIFGGIMLLMFGITGMIIVLSIIGLSLFSIYLLALHHIFPKKIGKRRMLSIRENLRKRPLLGTSVLLLLYALFLLLPNIAQLPLIFIYTHLQFIYILFIDFSLKFFFMALLFLLIVPKSLKFPTLVLNLKEYLHKIKLIPLKFNWKHLIIAICCPLIIYASSYIFGIFLGKLTFNPLSLFEQPSLYPPRLGWFIFIIMLIPGIWEEFSFRGVLMELNLNKYSPKITLIITSILFGLFHYVNLLVGQSLIITVNQSIYAAALGFLLGYIYLKTKSLLVPMIVHYLIDSVGQIFYQIWFDNLINFFIYGIFGLGVVPAILGMLLVKIITGNKSHKK
ncbi:MAG: CPBP family glutamic-type intramembrane protease [Promethearchaeota archaeon]